ncbi:MAG: hypothetical protein ACKON7_03750 [Planctomycetaceae bacterium]
MVAVALRLSALGHLGVIYVLTHDSIGWCVGLRSLGAAAPAAARYAHIGITADAIDSPAAVC